MAEKKSDTKGAAPTDVEAAPPSAPVDATPNLPASSNAIVTAPSDDLRKPLLNPSGEDSEEDDVEASGEEVHYAEVSWSDLIKQFSILGWVAFGGPAAHVGLYQKRLIEKLGWMPGEVFMELFALGQCLPGPSSGQVSFAVGIVKKGVLGGLVTGALFQYPGALLMSLLGIVAARVLSSAPFWVSCAASGVSAVGVALVASAAKGLLTKLCATRLLAIIATLTAAAAIYWPTNPRLFPLAMLIGGSITYTSHYFNKDDMTLKGNKEVVGHMGFSKTIGAALIVLWASILAFVCILVRTLDYDHRKDAKPLDWFEVFFRTGSIIYGGGQVVMPLLLGDLVAQDCSVVMPLLLGDLVAQDCSGRLCVESPVVPVGNSWVSSQQFYTGLGLAQAMPGPLFNFSAYLGAIIAWNFGYPPLIGSALAWLGLFYPGISLLYAVMPFWKLFRKWNVFRRSLDVTMYSNCVPDAAGGINAAAVGLILASVFRMTLAVHDISPFPTTALIIGLVAFTCVDTLKIFEPFVVIGGIGMGLAAWVLGMR
eukprot:gene910-5229_t